MLEKNVAGNILGRIAKIILLNADFAKDSGLFTGKAGALIFMYNYAKYSDSSLYSNYADELALQLSKQVALQPVGIYTSGIAGIGWAFDFLMKNDFIEIGDRFYNSINEKILHHHSSFNSIHIENAGLGIYLYNQVMQLQDKWYDDIDTMLKLEKLIGIIDCFDNNHDSIFSQFSNGNEVHRLIKNNMQSHLGQMLYHYSKAVHLISKVVDSPIYPAISKLLFEKMIQLLSQIIMSIVSAMDNVKLMQERKVDDLYIAFLEICNIYLQIASPSTETHSYIIKGCIYFDRNIYSTNEKILSENTDFGKMFHEITLLSQINGRVQERDIAEMINRGWERLLSFPFFHETGQLSNIPSCLKDEKKQTKIGLSDGVSNIGMTLLAALDPSAYVNWREALLLN